MLRDEWRRPMSEVLDFAAGRLDERGLIPLSEARRIVAAATEFRVGAHHAEGGVHFTDSDVLWGALLSLGTVDEFADATRRLRWVHGPRALDGNVDPFTRFGDEVTSWVGAFLGADGELAGAPSNLGTCLLQVGTDAAYELAGRIASVGGDTAAGRSLRDEWVRRHTDASVRCALDGRGGDATWHRATLRRAADIGHADARRHASPRGSGRRTLTAASVLRELDRGFARAEDLGWPFFGIFDHSGCHHATRLVAAVRPETGAWCVLFDQINGDCADMLEVTAWGYGTVPALGEDPSRNVPLDVTIEPEDAGADATVVVRSPFGTMTVTPADLLAPGLVPGARRATDSPDVARLRCWLRRHRAAVWPDAQRRVADVLGDGPFVVVASTDTFHHEDFTLPSTQATYRSLADALAHADPLRLVPGEPNTWFDDAERLASDG